MQSGDDVQNTNIELRSATERDLHEARSRLEVALAAGNVGTFVWDVRDDCVYGDSNFTRLFGVPLDARGTAPIDAFIAAIHPDDREPTLALIRQTLETGCEYRAEYRIVTDEGQRWALARGKVERDESGNVSRFPGALVDITEQKRAEQERQELAARYEHQTRLFDCIASTTPDFIYLFDLTGRFLYANRRLLEVWGKTFDEAVGRSLYELGYPDWHAEMHLREIDQVIRTKQPITGEVPFTGGSGIFGVYEYIFTPVLGADGQVEVVAGTTRDVTARKQTEKAVHEGKEQLDIALAASKAGTFRFDLTCGEFIAFDDNLRRLLGLHRTDAVRLLADFMRLVEPGDVQAVQAGLSGPLTGGGDLALEFRARRKDGSVLWLDAKGSVTRDAHGTPQYITGACVDISERKLVEQQRHELLEAERKARTDLEQASRLKDEFLATLSHELRTPLNAILGYSHILRQRQHDDSTRNGLAVIERNARAQVQLIEDLLDMSRIVEGKMRLDVHTVNLDDVIRAAVESVAPASEARGIRVQLVVDAKAGPVRGDAARLQQVLWNLLSNAIKFTPRGGKVVVALERVNSHVEITVTDTGAGIAPEFLPFVFDRFRQADGTITRQHGGLGLGLSIVRSLVEMHGGQVRAKSAGEGKGASFSVELPLMPLHEEDTGRRHPRASSPELAAQALEAHILAGLTVLVVDDEPDACELIKWVLEEQNARVLVAHRAAEAFELLLRERPDLLLSDIGMPGEDGYSLIGRVRSLPAEHGGDTAAVALTAFARSDDRRRALLAGFQAHVSKPVEPAELVAVLASVGGRIRKARSDAP